MVNWWKRRAKWFKITLISFISLLILARIIAPVVIKNSILGKLNKIEGFGATVSNVDISILSPSLTFYDLKLFSVENSEITPLFSADKIKGNLTMKSIKENKLLVHSVVTNPVITFLQYTDTLSPTEKGATKSNYENADKVSWGKEIGNLFSLSIDEFEILNGVIAYVHKKNGQDRTLRIDSIYTTLSNIANSAHKEEELYTSGELTARIMGHASLIVQVEIAPADKHAPFNLAINLKDFDIPSLNPFARTYANLDIQKGKFSMDSKVKSRDGIINGTLVPHTHSLEVTDYGQNEKPTIKNMLWQALVELITNILARAEENEDKVCEIKFVGTLKHFDITFRKNSEEMLSKIFVKAINKRLKSHTVTFEKIED